MLANTTLILSILFAFHVEASTQKDYSAIKSKLCENASKKESSLCDQYYTEYLKFKTKKIKLKKDMIDAGLTFQKKPTGNKKNQSIEVISFDIKEISKIRKTQGVKSAFSKLDHYEKLISNYYHTLNHHVEKMLKVVKSRPVFLKAIDQGPFFEEFASVHSSMGMVDSIPMIKQALLKEKPVKKI